MRAARLQESPSIYWNTRSSFNGIFYKRPKMSDMTCQASSLQVVWGHIWAMVIEFVADAVHILHPLHHLDDNDMQAI